MLPGCWLAPGHGTNVTSYVRPWLLGCWLLLLAAWLLAAGWHPAAGRTELVMFVLGCLVAGCCCWLPCCWLLLAAGWHPAADERN